MNKLLSALVIGSFTTAIFAAGPDETASAEKQNAIEQWQNNLPDSIKAKIDEHQKQMLALKTQMEVQRVEFRAKIDSQKVIFQDMIAEYMKTLPDSLKSDIGDIELPDSIKVKIEAMKQLRQQRGDSLKVIIEKRRAEAKADIEKELAKIDKEKKAKYEKALAQLEKKLAERQLKAVEAQKKLEAKKAEILAKIEQEKAANQQ